MIDQTVFNNKKAAYYTLGCKLNFAETSTIGKLLAEQGVRKVRPGEKADICVVNTCSVTELADKKCRQAIRRISKQHPGAFIVVTGCYAQLKPEEVSHIEGVDLVLGAEQKLEILQYLENLEKKEHGGTVIASQSKDIRSFSPSCSADDRTRHFLTDAIIIALIAPYPSPAEEAGTGRSPAWWNRRRKSHVKEERRSY